MRADVDAAGASGGPTLRDLVARLGPLQPSTPDVIAHVLREAIICGRAAGRRAASAERASPPISA